MKSDQVLVSEVRSGNANSFSQLVSRHQRLLLRAAVRMTRDLEMAEDIVQDAFIKAYQKIDMFEGKSSFKSWVYRIAINTAKNKLRSKSRDIVDIKAVSLSVSAGIERGLIQDDLRKAILDEVDSLPPKQRTALSLRIFEDLSFKEIAEFMQCPYDTAKANYRHALMKLRHRFQENEELKNFRDFQQIVPVVEGQVAEVD